MTPAGFDPPEPASEARADRRGIKINLSLQNAIWGCSTLIAIVSAWFALSGKVSAVAMQGDATAAAAVKTNETVQQHSVDMQKMTDAINSTDREVRAIETDQKETADALKSLSNSVSELVGRSERPNPER